MNSQTQILIQEVAAALIALAMVIGTIAVVVILILRGEDPNNVPAVLALALGAVISWYFQSRNTNGTIATLTNGPLHTVASLSQRAPQRSTDPQPTPTPEAPAA